MWARSGMVRAMASSIWGCLGHKSKPPSGLNEAAKDLLRLYEEANKETLDEIVRRMQRRHREVDPRMVCDAMLYTALGPSYHQPWATELVRGTGIAAPSFDLTVDGADVVWEGDANGGYNTNPTGGAPKILHLEDDVTLQRLVKRWLKKIYPDQDVKSVDNVADALTYLRAHPDTGLIVSDVNVRGPRDGIDFADAVEDMSLVLADRFVFFSSDDRLDDGRWPLVVKKDAATFLEFRHKVVQAANFDDEEPAPAPKPQRSATAPPPVRAVEPTVDEVARAVRQEAPAIQPQHDSDGKSFGRFGDRKVFINAVWARVSPHFPGMSMASFKDKLVHAHRDGLLQLARADLVQAMNQDAVEESEILSGVSSFHFIVDDPDERGRAPKPTRATTRAPALAPVQPLRTTSMPTPTRSFGAAVMEIANSAPSLRGPSGLPSTKFGDGVFISYIWDQMQLRPEFATMSRSQFDRELLRGLRENEVLLARADLVGAMDRDAVQRSEIRDLGSSFHLVSVRDPAGRW